MYKITILSLFLFCTSLFGQSPKHEIRAAWITTAWRLDWPQTVAKDNASALKQQAELIRILDKLQFLNFNTVFLQVRMRNDVIYPSKLEGWSSMVSGVSNQSPGYDPLAFAVEECHKRGLECHAWMITVPLGNTKQAKELREWSILKKEPDLCKNINEEWYLDPGNPESAKYLARLAGEMVSNYDIDGIHLDYIRYPELGSFPDSKTKLKSGSSQSLADWRRSNINRIVYTIYDAVKEIKPWVQVSSSPLGKHSDLPNLSSKGWNGYHKVFQDAKTWLNAGKHDFIAPMLYFREPIFEPFLADWKQESNGRPIAAGIALYMMNESGWKYQTISNEIKMTRKLNCGQSYFRTESLMKNTKNCADSIKMNEYRYPALLPPMSWISSEKPAAPKQFTVAQSGNNIVFSWIALPGKNKITYTIYYSTNKKIETNDARHILFCRQTGNKVILEIPSDFRGDYYFAVTSNDRYHNESNLSRIAKVRFLR